MKNIYRVGEFARRVGKSASTIRRWDREGRLVAKRGPGRQGYYDESDVQKALRIEPEESERKTVVYCRVSARAQMADLKLQVEAMRLFCLAAGVAVDEWVEEIGGGLNFKRKKFLDLMERIERFEIGHLLVAHK